jgi:hypothetical protein
MKLLIAKIWLSILGLAFVGLFIFMIMQIPVEVWITMGFFFGLGAIVGFTKWCIDQLLDIEDKASAEKVRRYRGPNA